MRVGLPMKSISHQEGLVASTSVAMDMSTTEEQDPLMLKEVTVLKTSGALGAQGATERSEGSSGMCQAHDCTRLHTTLSNDCSAGISKISDLLSISCPKLKWTGCWQGQLWCRLP